MGLLTLLVVLLGLGPEAHAQDIGTERTFGLGVTLGNPTGVSGKYYFAGPVHAVDVGVATEFIGFADDRITIYAAYLNHPVTLAHLGFAELPLFVGIGPQFWTNDLDDDINDDFDDDAAFGVRVPLGVDMNFASFPLQITGAVAGLVPFIPEVSLSADIYVAARYYF